MLVDMAQILHWRPFCDIVRLAWDEFVTSALPFVTQMLVRPCKFQGASAFWDGLVAERTRATGGLGTMVTEAAEKNKTIQFVMEPADTGTREFDLSDMLPIVAGTLGILAVLTSMFCGDSCDAEGQRR